MKADHGAGPALPAKVRIALAAGHETSALLRVAMAHSAVAAAEKVGARVDHHRPGSRAALAAQRLLLYVDWRADAKLGAPVLFPQALTSALVGSFTRRFTTGTVCSTATIRRRRRHGRCSAILCILRWLAARILGAVAVVFRAARCAFARVGTGKIWRRRGDHGAGPPLALVQMVGAVVVASLGRLALHVEAAPSFDAALPAGAPTRSCAAPRRTRLVGGRTSRAQRTTAAAATDNGCIYRQVPEISFDSTVGTFFHCVILWKSHSQACEIEKALRFRSWKAECCSNGTERASESDP